MIYSRSTFRNSDGTVTSPSSGAAKQFYKDHLQCMKKNEREENVECQNQVLDESQLSQLTKQDKIDRNTFKVYMCLQRLARTQVKWNDHDLVIVFLGFYRLRLKLHEAGSL